MMSCMFVFYPLLIGSLVAATGIAPARPAGEESPRRPSMSSAQSADPDALYASREDLAKARQAAAIWADRLQKDPKDFASAWKLARARYWLGGHAPGADRKQLLEEGIAAGRSAVAAEPNRPEGHFWIAANMGALAESFGMRQGLKYRGDIKDELLIVLKLDPAYQRGSADRASGAGITKCLDSLAGRTRSPKSTCGSP